MARFYLFYCAEELVSKVGSKSERLMRGGRSALAQKSASTRLLKVDDANTVVGQLDSNEALCESYSAYGYSDVGKSSAMVAFTGRWRDPVTGNYPLGNGHRSYSPSNRRFLSPDSLSPFGRGGINTYAYCAGDPVNRTDPSGRFSILKTFLPWRKTGLTKVLQNFDFRRPGSLLSAKSVIKEVVSSKKGLGVESFSESFYYAKSIGGCEIYNIAKVSISYEGGRFKNLDYGFEKMPVGHYYSNGPIAFKSDGLSPEAASSALLAGFTSMYSESTQSVAFTGDWRGADLPLLSESSFLSRIHSANLVRTRSENQNIRGNDSPPAYSSLFPQS